MGQPEAADAFWARRSRPIWPDSDDAVGQPTRINTRKAQKSLNSIPLSHLVSFGKYTPKVTHRRAVVCQWKTLQNERVWTPKNSVWEFEKGVARSLVTNKSAP